MSLLYEIKDDKLNISENNRTLLVVEPYLHDFTEKYFFEEADEDIVLKIINGEVAQIPSELEFYYSPQNYNFGFEKVSWFYLIKATTFVKITASIIFDWEEWKHPFTIQEFLENYQTEMKNKGYDSSIEKDDNWASLNLTFIFSEGIIIEKTEEVIVLAKEICNSLLLKLSKNNSKDLFAKVFEFPQEHKVVCSQYLIWFGEFLKNFGIDANVSTENNGAQTSVIVAPNDAKHLTEDIESLFYQYLSLPYVKQLPSTQSNHVSIETQVGMQMLYNQVEFYKNQIQMKESVIQLKNATIEKQTSELLLFRSMKNSQDIELFNGVVKIGDFGWQGFKISPKNLIDTVKCKFNDRT